MKIHGKVDGNERNVINVMSEKAASAWAGRASGLILLIGLKRLLKLYIHILYENLFFRFECSFLIIVDIMFISWASSVKLCQRCTTFSKIQFLCHRLMHGLIFRQEMYDFSKLCAFSENCTSSHVEGV